MKDMNKKMLNNDFRFLVTAKNRLFLYVAKSFRNDFFHRL